MTYSFQNKKRKMQQFFYKRKNENNILSDSSLIKHHKTPFISDPFSDILTRIRNGCNKKKKYIFVPYSKKNLEFLNVLTRENLIKSILLHSVTNLLNVKKKNSNTYSIQIELKYSPIGESRISKIVQVSKFSRKISCRLTHIQNNKTNLLIPKHIRFIPQNEYTLWILNTSQGILSEREAVEKNIAGEVLCWIL